MTKKLRKITIIIGHLPERELSPNSRVHWSVKGKAVRTAKDEIGWLAKEQWHDDKPMMMARISYLFHLKDRRVRDLDNLLASCKAYQDGLIEAGVIFYDDSQHLEIGSVKAIITGTEGMDVTVEEIMEAK
jgi:Holliday junction resolvase RusA-like endonuclease